MTPPLDEVNDLIERLETLAPPNNPKFGATVAALRASLEKQAQENEKSEELLKEYEAAYEKLTAPANRLGCFIKWVDQDKALALIAAGESEYVANVDPMVDASLLVPGVKIRLNEGLAVVGVSMESRLGPLVKIVDVLEGDRLRVGGATPGSDSRFVLRASTLADTKIEAGDEVRLDSSGRFAVEHFESKEARDYFLEEVPELPWEAVGGQQDAIKLIRDTIEKPLLHPEVFRAYDKKPIKGILLYGPPGCGKTLIGKATAHNLTKEYGKLKGREVKEAFLSISGPKILNMWLGESERLVREIFSAARAQAKQGNLVFIFLDEAESLLRTRSTGRYLNISNTIVPQFCAELDGLVGLENVVLMLTSNRPDFIDPAVLRPGRIDRKVKVNRPDKAASEQILGIYLTAELPFDPALLKENDGDPDCARSSLIKSLTDSLWAINRSTEFVKAYKRSGEEITLYRKDMVSGALLKSIVDRAKDIAIERALTSKAETGLRLQDLEEAMAKEYKENEIFPTGDSLDDWLQLIDQPPESIVRVKPIHAANRKSFGGHVS